ncbi:hypothetical protein DH2020_017707 [Rehmannia glutinosa]|uniref:ribose-5-phosphate isomerase n=1 Tax=Rehmannia glutinosa TaxID=99300 RepID=A0ABR0WRP6_REHGL
MEIMALSSSSSILPFSNFSLNLHSNRKTRSVNVLPMAVRSSLSDDSTLLLQAAKYTVDSFVENGMVVGLGSGRASVFAIQYLGRQLRSGAVKNITGIPTSVDSASEAAKAGVPLGEYRDSSNIDLAFNDADVIEEESLAAVIGRQKMLGDTLVNSALQTILRAAGKLVLIGTAKQYQGAVDGSIPVLIKSINWLETAEEIDDLFLGDAEVLNKLLNTVSLEQSGPVVLQISGQIDVITRVDAMQKNFVTQDSDRNVHGDTELILIELKDIGVWRRPSVGYADPLGGDFPLITKEGHNVLDVIFTSPIQSLAEVADSLDQVVGVVEHGVISRIPCTAVIATEDGLRIVDNTLKIEGSMV